MTGRKELGSTLRELRLQQGLTQSQLATEAGIQQGQISKIESGRVTPTIATVERLAAALRLSQARRKDLLARVTALQTELATHQAIARGGMRREQRRVQKLEMASTTIRTFQPAMVPGLLQTPAYARSVFLSAARYVGAADVDDAVRARLERQAVLSDTSKQFIFVLTVQAITWGLAPPHVMASQVRHLLSLSAEQNVDIGIIPPAASVPVPPLNAFVIFDSRLVLVETLADELRLGDPGDIAVYEDVFETLLGAALRGTAAHELLTNGLARPPV